MSRTDPDPLVQMPSTPPNNGADCDPACVHSYRRIGRTKKTADADMEARIASAINIEFNRFLWMLEDKFEPTPLKHMNKIGVETIKQHAGLVQSVDETNGL